MWIQCFPHQLVYPLGFEWIGKLCWLIATERQSGISRGQAQCWEKFQLRNSLQFLFISTPNCPSRMQNYRNLLQDGTSVAHWEHRVNLLLCPHFHTWCHAWARRRGGCMPVRSFSEQWDQRLKAELQVHPFLPSVSFACICCTVPWLPRSMGQ